MAIGSGGYEYKQHLKRELRQNPEYAKGKKIILFIAITLLILNLSQFPGEYLALGGINFELGHLFMIAILIAVTIIIMQGFIFLGAIYYLYIGLTQLSQILLVSYYIAGEGNSIAIGKFISDNGAISIWLIIIAMASIIGGVCLFAFPQIRRYRKRTSEIRSEYPSNSKLYYK